MQTQCMAPTSPKWGQYWIFSLLPHIDLDLRQGAKPLAVPGSKKWYRQTSQGLSYTETCWVAAGLGTISPDSYAGPARWWTTAEHVLVPGRTRVQVMPRSCMHDTSVQNRSDACTSPKPWRCDVFDTSKRCVIIAPCCTLLTQGPGMSIPLWRLGSSDLCIRDKW